MKNYFIIGCRLIMALVVCAAVITQLYDNIENHRSIINFFSFFTIQSNIFATVIIMISAFLMMQNRTWKPMAILQGAATTYMVITGVVFALLLSGLVADLQTTIPWVNDVLHKVFPLYMLLDWLFVPPKQSITFKRALAWVIYPLIYLVYSLIRGAAIDWYPYPFLNPDKGGYAKVVVLCSCIFAGALLLIALLTAIQRWRVRALRAVR